MLITDTTGFESYVTENNPKFYQATLKKVKTYAKTLDNDKKKSFDVEKFAGSLMPKVSSSKPEAKLTFLNGHFGYYIKIIISTNAFGLVRDINFYNNDNELDSDLRPQDIKDEKVRNTTSIQTDIMLAGISQLISFIIISKTSNHHKQLAIKSLIA